MEKAVQKPLNYTVCKLFLMKLFQKETKEKHAGLNLDASLSCSVTSVELRRLSEPRSAGAHPEVTGPEECLEGCQGH